MSKERLLSKVSGRIVTETVPMMMNLLLDPGEIQQEIRSESLSTANAIKLRAIIHVARQMVQDGERVAPAHLIGLNFAQETLHAQGLCDCPSGVPSLALATINAN